MDSVKRFFDFWFFHESISPKPLSIPLGSFRIFSKILGDIRSRSSRCITCVVDTRWQMEKSSIIKVFIILFGHLWEVELTYRYIFAFKFTLRSRQPDIVPTGVNDTGGKFAAGVVDTGGAPWLANIYSNFWKNLKKTVLMGNSGAGGKLNHEKKEKQKISWHCPFK